MPMSSLPAAILSQMIAVSNVSPPPLLRIPNEWGKSGESAIVFSVLTPEKRSGAFEGC